MSAFVAREAYDALDRVNWSSLKHMARSPLHYRHALDAEERPDTAALKLGRAVHVAVLEPELFASLYVVWEGGRRAGKAWDAFVEENAATEILTQCEYDQCVAIQRAVRRHPIAAELLSGGRSEVTLQWDHRIPAAGDMPEIVTPCKGRADYVGAALVDLKTTRDASPDAFGREAWRLQYHAQLAFYHDGLKAMGRGSLPVRIVAIEKEPPYAVAIYVVTDYLLEVGRQEYTALLSSLDWWRSRGCWPAYSDGEMELTLPRWAVPAEVDDVSDLDLIIGGE